MKIYNTLTKKTEDIKPLKPPVVSVYTCGPTVYDYPHVGNWFNYIRMDMLIRTLKANELTTKWVMNITDVGHLTSDADEGEDKLEKGAKREGKSAWEIADFYTKDFLEGMKTLNILTPDFITKATDHIEDQIELIKTLEEKGYVYIIDDDGVYFDTSKFEDYSKFANLDLDEQYAGIRVQNNPKKKHPSDFALWKFSPKDKQRDMEWDSPWGKGFPGWHIECSAMSMKYLGKTIDMHTGGIDHIPIHHTNEIAQSQAATGKPLARYWLHANHILIENEKISKSLANTVTLKDVTSKGYSPEVFRLHVLESHYRSQSKFSWQSLEAAKNRYADLAAMSALRYQASKTTNDATTFSLEDVPLELTNILNDDLNTPQALALLSRVSLQLLAVLVETDMLPHFITMLEKVDKLLGLRLSEIKDISDDQKDLIKKRSIAREHDDWQKADEIRQKLEKQNIGLRDTAYGTIWFPL